MKKLVCVYTPMNPMRPHYGRLKKLHERNVAQNDRELFDYYSEEVMLPLREQKSPILRGRNVIRAFNDFYERVKDDYQFICKWDDDMIMPPDIIKTCYKILKHSEYKMKEIKIIGCGLFQEDYGAPNILMHPTDGWYGAFSRFYMYRMDVWGVIPIDFRSGDPDNDYQRTLKGNKHILDVPSIHLDHRAFPGRKDEYRVVMDVASFFIQ